MAFDQTLCFSRSLADPRVGTVADPADPQVYKVADPADPQVFKVADPADPFYKKCCRSCRSQTTEKKGDRQDREKHKA